MTDFIASIVEWFAILTMSMIGIEYRPPVNCAETAPAEYREAAFFPGKDGFSEIRESGNDCLSLDINSRSADLPVLLETPVVYES